MHKENPRPDTGMFDNFLAFTRLPWVRHLQVGDGEQSAAEPEFRAFLGVYPEDIHSGTVTYRADYVTSRDQAGMPDPRDEADIATALTLTLPEQAADISDAEARRTVFQTYACFLNRTPVAAIGFDPKSTPDTPMLRLYAIDGMSYESALALIRQALPDQP